MLPLALSSYTTDWLDLLVRWLHVIAGIAWIGSSFYFIALDNHLHLPEQARDAGEGVGGEAWEIHGGGFYHVLKYKVAPPKLPEPLLWFKWEAYTTWLSGFALLIVLYYVHAGSNLVDRSVADLSSGQAVLISVGLLVGGWILYDILCRTVGQRSELLLAVAILGIAVAAAYGSSRLFAPRAAYLQVGSMLGTMMAANVFFVIIPAHWELVRAKKAGREPDPLPGLRAKQRSVHNNYLTLPVVFTMISNHFPITYGHSRSWLILVALMVIGAWVRHFFNLRHVGVTAWWIPVTAAAGIALVAVLIRPASAPSVGVTPGKPATGSAQAGRGVFASAGCAACHTLRRAGAKGTVGPNLDAVKPSRELVVDRVTNGQGVMPSFKGKLSPQQIEDGAGYVSSVAGK